MTRNIGDTDLPRLHTKRSIKAAAAAAVRTAGEKKSAFAFRTRNLCQQQRPDCLFFSRRTLPKERAMWGELPPT